LGIIILIDLFQYFFISDPNDFFNIPSQDVEKSPLPVPELSRMLILMMGFDDFGYVHIEKRRERLRVRKYFNGV
jgi:hypothetical protein